MTLDNLLSQMGIGAKQLTDRYAAEYGAPPAHDQHIYYAYEPSPPAPGPMASSKHTHITGGVKSNASMSALTLLAFLFFLHILQQCIKEHMTEMSTPPVVVMSAGREGEDLLSKTGSKIDKTGVTQLNTDEEKLIKSDNYAKNPYRKEVRSDDNMMRIKAAEHKTMVDEKTHGKVYKNDANRGSFPGFVSAMENDF